MKKQKLIQNKNKQIEYLSRSVCPIANALDILGDKWTLLIIRDLLFDKHTYGDFQSSPEGIPSNILADRLKRLEHHGLIDKQPYQERPVRYAYFLTEKGKALQPTMMELVHWGLKYIPGAEAKMLPGKTGR